VRPPAGRRRPASSYVAEGLQVAIADGLELACTMAMELARHYRSGELTDQGAAKVLEEFAEMVTQAKDNALDLARQQRLDGQAL